MRTGFFILTLILSSRLFAGGIEKAYEALKVYNYFEAKSLFKKNLKKDSVACAYGLSVIHFREDNPFQNKNKSLLYFEIILRNFPEYNEKQKSALKELGIQQETIDTLKNQLGTYFFDQAHTESDLEEYLTRFSWAKEYDEAAENLDAWRYEKALQGGNSDAFRKFIGFYPESEYYYPALKRYQKAIYEEQTCDLAVGSYKNFIHNFPESPYAERAQDRIYELITGDRTLDSYEFFIHEYPENKNVYDAWKKLYQEFMTVLTEERYLSFKENYPDYPFMGDLEVEFKLSKIKYLPFKQYDSWGFIDTVGFIRVKAEYETVEKFREGLAVVSKDDLYGAINKQGDVIIPMKYEELYDFYEGTAVCAKGGKYGMVNTSGEEIMKLEYDDVMEMKNGLAIAEKEGLFGYYDKNGFEKIEAIYDEVNQFEEGLAIVSKDGLYGIIDPYGIPVLDFQYDNLIKFNELYYAAETEDGWGIITIEKDTVLDFEMDLIQPVYNGFAYFELDEEYGFLNENGRIAIEVDYPVFADDKQLCYFKNGHALVKSGDRFGLINEKGRKVIPTIFYGIGHFDELIPITKGDLWGYCDERANRKIDYQFDMAYNFEGDYAVVIKEGKMGLINKKGEFVLNPEYDEILRVENKYYKLKKQEKFGLIDLDLDVVLPVKNDELILFSDVLIQTFNGGELQYFNLRTKDYIEVE